MGLRKHKNGIWYIDLLFHGKRYTQSTGTTHKKLAQDIHDAKKTELIRTGAFPKRIAESKTFFELCKNYESKIPERSKNVIKSNLNVLMDFFGDRPLSDIGPAEVDRFKDDLKARGKSIARINHLVSTLKRMFQIATVQWEWFPVNPLAKVELEKGANKRIRLLTSDEEARLIEGSPIWLRELIRFDLLSGFRLSECLSIRIKDIDLKSKRLTCWEVKGGGSRTIPIGLDLERFLLDRLRVVDISGLLFPYKSWKVERAVKMVCAKVGIEDFRFHDLRHLVTTRLLKAGASDRQVMRFMGWRSPAMLSRYGHLQVDDVRDVADLLK